MSYKIIRKYEHYEVYRDGKFFCSADTEEEARMEIRNEEQC